MPEIEENFGPFFQERVLPDGSTVAVPGEAEHYQDYIHVTAQP